MGLGVVPVSPNTISCKITHVHRQYLCLPFLTTAPSAAPSRLSVRLSGQSYYASWRGLSEEQRNGQLEYQVLLYQCAAGTTRTHLSVTECRRCVQQAAHTTLTTPHTSTSLLGATQLDTAYAVQVRGVTGQGSLKGPLSPPTCFTTPEGGRWQDSHCNCHCSPFGRTRPLANPHWRQWRSKLVPSPPLSSPLLPPAPNQAPAVRYSVVLGQAVCVEWDALVRGLQSGEVLGYRVTVSEGRPAGDPASFHRYETNVTDPARLHYLLSNLREGLSYNITVQAYSRAGSGPPSDRIVVQPMQCELAAALRQHTQVCLSVCLSSSLYSVGDVVKLVG